ncbi:spore germination protein GerPB [Paenibacillus sp. FSL W8-0187]|uniref:spore germination protein GerPB n=1 Tax=Paenibacillus sp. FSL W8-0187 TaxID=2921710 RepID=UPI0030DCBA81
MNLTVHQCINIQQLRVGAVTNSSVLQIGTAGEIRALSNIYNTGGFTGPAPEFEPQNSSNNPLVPLPAPIEGLYRQE